MNKNNKNIGLIITVVIGIIVIAGGGLLISNQNSQKQDTTKMAIENAAMMKQDETSTENKIMADNKNSNYVEYSKANLDSSINVKRLLFFYASWCPICRPVDTALKSTQIIPDGVSVIRVNFNDPDTDQEEKDLAKKYGVTYQHTFVQIDENGNALKKWTGEEIKEILSNLK